jgi:hypothetical protein
VDRRQFISTVGAASAAAAASTAVSADAAHAAPPAGPAALPPEQVDNRFLDALTTVNNLQIPGVLASYQEQIDSLASPRALAQSALRLVIAYVNPRGQNFHNPALLGPLDVLLDALADRQNPSGLYDIGNLDSPPDTSFVISDLGLGYDLLHQDAEPATIAAREKYAAIMQRSARSLAEGGVHTPNHRWEICKALAHLHHLWPSRLLISRINDWLGEGIDQDAEGQYSERSAIYASEVTNRSLLTIARLADKPRLRDNVRRNLAATLYLLEVNGEVETANSRRQDQTGGRCGRAGLRCAGTARARSGNGRGARNCRRSAAAARRPPRSASRPRASRYRTGTCRRAAAAPATHCRRWCPRPRGPPRRRSRGPARSTAAC